MCNQRKHLAELKACEERQKFTAVLWGFMEEHQYYSITHLSSFPVCSVSFWILAYATIMSCLFMFFHSPQSKKDGMQSCIATALLSHSNHFNSHYIFLQDLDCDMKVDLQKEENHAALILLLCSAERSTRPAEFIPKHTLKLQKWEFC